MPVFFPGAGRWCGPSGRPGLHQAKEEEIRAARTDGHGGSWRGGCRSVIVKPLAASEPRRHACTQSLAEAKRQQAGSEQRCLPEVVAAQAIQAPACRADDATGMLQQWSSGSTRRSIHGGRPMNSDLTGHGARPVWRVRLDLCLLAARVGRRAQSSTSTHVVVQCRQPSARTAAGPGRRPSLLPSRHLESCSMCVRLAYSCTVCSQYVRTYLYFVVSVCT